MPSTKHRDSRRPYRCATNRRMTTVLPWDERGDFVYASVTEWAKENGSTPSRVIMNALEWYFTNQSPREFYDRVVDMIEDAEFKRLHRPETGGICHRLSCHICYSKRSKMYAEASLSASTKQR